jgi:hypothetical protein
MNGCKVITKEDLTRENFHWTEWFKSDTAKKLGIDNYPDPIDEFLILDNLMSTADMGQEIRDILGCVVSVSSAFRCKILNDAVGSSDRSQHLQGLAIDLKSNSFGTPKEIMIKLHSVGFLVDQCLCEGSWLHVSRLNNQESKNRMMYGYYLPNPKTGKREFKAI